MKGFHTTEVWMSGDIWWEKTRHDALDHLPKYRRIPTRWGNGDETGGNAADINILGFMEANTCWDLLTESQQLSKQTRGWWEISQWSLMYNRQEINRFPHQAGGTGILCVNQVAHWAQCPGDDPLGLGQWCWTCLWGPMDFFVRIITMYQPCFSMGPQTTYQQQVHRFLK